MEKIALELECLGRLPLEHSGIRVSYFTVLVRFPITRNVAWVNFLLFGADALFLLTGLKRAFTKFGSIGEKFVSSASSFFARPASCLRRMGHRRWVRKLRTSLCAIRVAPWFLFPHFYLHHRSRRSPAPLLKGCS